MGEAIQRRKLSEQVPERLKLRIVSGEIAPGAQLASARGFMEEYGVMHVLRPQPHAPGQAPATAAPPRGP
jgi:DNA-binding FadR family transcriptional regulator